MHAYRNTRRGLTLAATAALLAATAYAAAAMAAPDGTHHAARGVVHRAAAGAARGARGAGDAATTGGTATAATPGWRVVKKFGPDPSVSGLLTAVSATDAWSVWSGTKFALVEHFARGAWHQVPLPASLDAYLRSAVSIGANSASDVWIFATHPATKALRWTGAKWRLQPIPPAPRAGGSLTSSARPQATGR